MMNPHSWQNSTKIATFRKIFDCLPTPVRILKFSQFKAVLLVLQNVYQCWYTLYTTISARSARPPKAENTTYFPLARE